VKHTGGEQEGQRYQWARYLPLLFTA